MVDSIVSMAKKEIVEKKDDKIDKAKVEELARIKNEEIAKSKNDIKLLVKAMVANNLWNYSEYFEIINPSRPEYIKAIEVLHDKKLYAKKLSKS